MSGTLSVTVVTVTYQLIASGRADYFRECVESVHNQTHKNIEHIVIDGASDDGTIALIDEYAQNGWLTYISEPDCGIYDAMNKAIARASGNYIIFLNSDDFYHEPRAIELSVAALETSHADFSFAPVVMRSPKREYVAQPSLLKLLFGVPLCHQSVMCRETLFRDVGFFRAADYRIAADYEFLLRSVLAGKASVAITVPIVTYRRDGASGSDVRLACEEIARVMSEQYRPWKSLSVQQCRNYHRDRVLPLGLLISLRRHHSSLRQLITCGSITRMLMRRVIRWCFSLRVRRGYRHCRIFGLMLWEDNP